MKQLLVRFSGEVTERVVDIDNTETSLVRELLRFGDEVTISDPNSDRYYRFKDANDNPTLRECMVIPDLEQRFWALSEFMDRYVENAKRAGQ